VTLQFDAERAPLVVGAVFLALALHGIGSYDVVGDDEAREVGIVQDVVAGHWLWPRFNDRLIPDKPILFHWVAAIPCLVAGFSETAVRLPSALAAAGLVAWTTWFGMQALGANPGIAAGLLLATSPAFFDRARVARPDTLMLLLLAAALGLGWTAWRHDRRGDATWALVLLGLATFVKGPVPPVLFGATMVAFLAWQRDLRRLGLFLSVPGIVAFVVLGLGWYAVAMAGWGDEFVRQHLVGRYVRNLAGGLTQGRAYSPKSLGYHLSFYPIHLLSIALPWTPLIVAAVVRLVRRRGFANPLVRFLVCWTVVPVVVFTPAEYKLRYYLLPCLPPLALLAAPLAVELVTRPLGRLRATRQSIVAAVIVLVAGAAAVWLALARPDRLSEADQAVLEAVLASVPGGKGVAAAIAGVLLGLTGAAVVLRLWGPLAAVTGALTIGWLAVGAPTAAVRASQAQSLRPFADTVRARFPEPGGLAFYGETVRSVIVYVGHPVPSLGRDAGRITPGLGVIATPAAYEVLAGAGYVGPTLAIGSGLTGNLERSTLVLAEGLEKPR